MLLDVLSRLVGAGVIGVAGWQAGAAISRATSDQGDYLPWGLVFTLAGVVIGALAMPYILFKPLAKILNAVNQLSLARLSAATGGLVVGLVIAVLISVPLLKLDGWVSWGVPLIISFSLASLGLWIGAQKHTEMRRLLHFDLSGPPRSFSASDSIVVDTSAIIDGRIADLGQTGFLQGTLVIPSFVLDELRHIADSSDPLRRNRGRRGLEVLGRLRKDQAVPIQVLDVDILQGAEVDRELVKLAQRLDAPILTTDFNLNQVAELQGIRVLNVNELASSLKSMVLPGEEITVNIVQEGKEVGQGVAFLDDGTMIVVEGGRRYLNSLQDVTITRVLQTSAGRIIFAQPKAG